MNIGLPKSEYYRLFGPTPERPGKGGVVATGHDFTRRNVLMPHPVYGWMAWTAIVDPEQDSFDKMRPLLTASYQHAVARFEKRLRENQRKAARL